MNGDFLVEKISNKKTTPSDRRLSITSVDFKNYKALAQFSLSLHDVNVLVGINNSGKSTILNAFRALDVALKKARSRNPEHVYGPNGYTLGYSLSPESFPTALENVHTDYAEVSTTVTFRLSNSNKLQLFFPDDGGWLLIPEPTGKPIRAVSAFRDQYPISIACVPVLGPVEHHETLLTYDTVQRNLSTHLASRHFRNYWYQNSEGFATFAQLVRETWPGMEVEAPELITGGGSELAMYCRENRITRELFWSGFGFQIWCQLLTHFSRIRDASLLIVDEPEVYLHPDVQRQLLSLLRSLGLDVLLASHSSAIIAEADPSEILLVDKQRRSARRLRDVSGVQYVLNAIGSAQNLTLTRLARNRTLLFTEGEHDFDILRHFARKLGLTVLGAGTDLTPVTSDGFSSLDRVKALGWGLQKALGQSLQIAAVYDRDYYYCPEQIGHIAAELQEHVDVAHIHARKEIENYLLVPSVLQCALDRELRDKAQRAGTDDIAPFCVSDRLVRISDPLKVDIQSQYVARRIEFFRRTKSDDATIARDALTWFEEHWSDLDKRMCVVPGKEVLSALRYDIQKECGVSLTTHKIIGAFQNEEIPADMVTLLYALQKLRARSLVAAPAQRFTPLKVERKSLL